MPGLIRNPFYAALTSAQSSFAIANGRAVRYQPDTIPFGAVSEPTPAAMQDLRDRLAPGESIFTTGESFPGVEGLLHTLALPGLQMHFTGANITQSPPVHNIQKLTTADVPDMLALKAIAFPGFFGPRAIELGDFFGIRIAGGLVAMAGERLCTNTHREISAVCTHPEHTGQGYAASLMQAVMQAQVARGVQSILHVVAANTRAIALYKRLGFETAGEVIFQRFKRVS